MTCPGCGSDEPQGAAFCGACGTPLAGPAPAITCAQCGNEESEGSAFCGRCGATLEAAALQPDGDRSLESHQTCPACGNEEPEDSAFCGACGTSLASAPAVVLEPVAAAPPPEALPPVSPPPVEALPPVPPPESTVVVAAEPSAPRPRRVRPALLVAVLALLVLVGAGAALWMTGVFGGGGSGESESSFAGDVNDNVLGPLQRADAVAAEHARRAVGGALLATDGAAIVDAADRATAYLRGLSGRSTQQQLETQMLLAFVAANRAYGNALARFSPSNGSSLIAVEGAARAARSTLAIVHGRLSSEFGLPLAGVFVTPRAAPPPPPPPPPPPAPPPPATTEVVPTTTTAPSGSAHVVRTYTASLETMLEGLARGRARLKTALGGALGCTLAYQTAANEVLGVVDNRAVIWNQLNGTHPPTAQTAALKATLLSALEHSMAADRHYRDWLQQLASAHAGCPPPLSGADYQAAGQDDAQASSLKKRFAASFNPLARQLGLRSWAATDF